jgi:predicted secreted acid phosphatase
MESLVPRRLIAPALLALALVLSVLVSPAEAAMPTRQRWVADTYKALNGSRAYVRDRVARGGSKLAINFDIDNTALATHYAAGKAVAPSLRLAKYAKSKGVYILFNTGRNVSQRARTIAELKAAGYPFDGLCAHYPGEALAKSKQRCRLSFVNNGFTIIANVGNRSTDFVGTNYESSHRLPNYGNRLR